MNPGAVIRLFANTWMICHHVNVRELWMPSMILRSSVLNSECHRCVQCTVRLCGNFESAVGYSIGFSM